jgi:hypothetical protein
MKMYQVTIPVYADNERQATSASEALSGFVGEMKAQGRAVTAPKLVEAVSRWQQNAIVKNEILRHFPKIAK